MLLVFLGPASHRYLYYGIAVCGGILLIRLLCARCFRYAMLWLAGIFLAGTIGTYYISQIRTPLRMLDGTTCTLTAKITDVRLTSSNSIQYTLSSRYQNIPFRADWYADGSLSRIEIGDTVLLEAELSALSSDYVSHAAEYGAGIGSYLRVRKAKLLGITDHPAFSWKRILRKYRDRITTIIHRQLPESDAAFLLAMLFGETRTLSDEVSAALYQTGIGHITAVSGLHLMFFCTLLSSILRRLSASPKERFLIHCAAVLVFSVMVDSAVSVARAGVMFLLAQAAALFGRYSDTMRALCIAVIGCTVCTPYVIASASFWLSVSGVIGIGIFAPWMTEKLPDSLKQIPAFRQLSELFCVSIAVFPASILFCGESSLLSPFCNLVILPLSTIALFLALLTVCTGGLTAFLLPIAGILCRMATRLAGYAAKIPYSHLQTNSKAMTAALLAGTGFVLLIILSTKNRKHTACAILCCGAVLSAQLAFSRISAHSQLRIAALGKSQDCILVISADGRTLVADFSGNPRDVKYVAQYLSNDCFRTSEIDYLYCRPASAAAFSQTIPDAKAVCFSEPSTLRSNLRICGTIPDVSPQQPVRLTIGGAEILLHPKEAEIRWKHQTIRILPADSENPVSADAVIRYGGFANTEDTCRIRLCTADDAQKNHVITLSGDGSASVRALS